MAVYAFDPVTGDPKVITAGTGVTVTSSSGVLTISATGGGGTGTVSGSGTVGFIPEWTWPTALGDSTLKKTGAGVLTLNAASPYTLTVPATGTAALLEAANAFTNNNTIASGKFFTALTDGNTGGLRAGTTADVLLYRSALNTWRTPDNFVIDGGLSVAAASRFESGLNISSSYGAIAGQLQIRQDSVAGPNMWISAINTPTTTMGITFYKDTLLTEIIYLGLDIPGSGVTSDIIISTWVPSVWTERFRFSFAGQLQVPTVGSAAGLLLGGDTQIYRSAANVLQTPDSLIIDGYLSVSGAPVDLETIWFYK